MFFFKNYARNEVGRLVLHLVLFFKKVLYELKANGLQALNLEYNKSKLYKTLDYFDLEMFLILIFWRRVWKYFSTTFFA